MKRKVAAMKVKLNITRIISRTFRKHTSALLANLEHNNVLFRMLAK
jgi:hypothetical protein